MVFQRLWVSKLQLKFTGPAVSFCSFSGFLCERVYFFRKAVSEFRSLSRSKRLARIGLAKKVRVLPSSKVSNLLLLIFGSVAEILICLHNWAVYFTVLLFCKVQILSNFSGCCQITSYKSDYSNELLSILSQFVLFIML